MEYRIKCTSCKKTGSYDKIEYENIGTFAVPIFGVRCHSCGKFIKTDGSDERKSFPKNKELILERDIETDGIIIGTKNKRLGVAKKADAIERAATGDIREYWVQQFFKEFAKDYGFKNIEGPFDTGPDFTTSGGVGIEIERVWKSYIAHGHVTNRSFSNVKYLVLLSPDKPPANKLALLPKKIIYIDREKFVPWFRESCRKYAEEKRQISDQQQLPLRLGLIKGEFYRRWLQVCDRTDGDMAICPSCQGCAYEPEFDFYEWAIEFIFYYDYSLWDENFSFAQIVPNHIDKFFIDKLNGK